jgi:hypothetical protein
MTDSFKDLDALVPTDKQVRFGGITYSLPGDIPLEIFVRVNKAQALEEEDRDSEAMEELVSALTDLFSAKSAGRPEYDSVRNTVEQVLRSRGVQFLTSLIQNIYSSDDPEPVEGDEAGKSTAAGTTTASTS